MDIKEYLKQVQSIDRMINIKQQEIDSLRSIATSTALHIDSERIQSSGRGDKVGDCVVKIADLMWEINKCIDAFIDLKAEIIRDIDMLEDLEERQVLYLRYFRNLEFLQIAKEMNMSERTAYRVHKSALKNLSILKVGGS